MGEQLADIVRRLFIAATFFAQQSAEKEREVFLRVSRIFE
jgi:hypothetical protein